MKTRFFAIILAVTMLATFLGVGVGSASAAVTSKPTTSVSVVQSNTNLQVKNGPQSTLSAEKGFLGPLFKKLGVKALRFAAPYVEKGLAKIIGEKWAKKASGAFYKVADLIESVQKVPEYAVANIFMAAGLPPDIAYKAAHYLCQFLC